MTIPGTAKMPHMLDNIGADEIRLTPEEVSAFNAGLAQAVIRPEYGSLAPHEPYALKAVPSACRHLPKEIRRPRMSFLRPIGSLSVVSLL